MVCRRFATRGSPGADRAWRRQHEAARCPLPSPLLPSSWLHTLPTLKAPVAPTPSQAPASAGQAGVVTAADTPDAPFEITEVARALRQLRPVPAALLRHHAPAHRALVRRQHPLRGLLLGEQSARRLSLRQGPRSACSCRRPARVPGTGPTPQSDDRSADGLGRGDGSLGALRRDGHLQELPRPGRAGRTSMECRMLNGFYCYQPGTSRQQFPRTARSRRAPSRSSP